VKVGCKVTGNFGACVGCGDDGSAIIAVEAQVREPRIKVETCGWERGGFGIEYSRGYGFFVGVVAMASLSSLASRYGGGGVTSLAG
jgi:hypothetical protein